MRTAAVLPVKRFARAKQRLGGRVADPLRMALAAAMVADVMLALQRTESIEATIVVTGEGSLAAHAGELGAIVVADASERGQSAAAAAGIEAALARGIERVLCVPGDCPALEPAELESLLGEAQHGEREVVIVPDRHGTGTNGLLLTPPRAIAPAFGPGSCERHRELARAAGVRCRLAHLPSLLLDVDTGADLEALAARLEGHGTSAERTRAVLGRPAPAQAAAFGAGA